jgi:hypothetical protein
MRLPLYVDVTAKEGQLTPRHLFQHQERNQERPQKHLFSPFLFHYSVAGMSVFSGMLRYVWWRQ